jgi:anti-anti-sigma factor
MAKPDLKITIKAEKDAVTVSMVGEAHFDIEAGEARVEEVAALKPKVVNVDASKLTFISSTGICFLISLRNAARQSKGKIYLMDLQPMVQQALQHARVLQLFDRRTEDAKEPAKAAKK